MTSYSEWCLKLEEGDVDIDSLLNMHEDWEAERAQMLAQFEQSVQTIAKLYVVNDRIIKTNRYMRSMVRKLIIMLHHGDNDHLWRAFQRIERMVGCNDSSNS